MDFWSEPVYGGGSQRDSGPVDAARKSDVRHVDEELRAAQARIDKLALTCQALREILRDNTGLTDEMLLQKVQEIDLRDGRADGKMSGAKLGTKCTNCGRPLNRKHRKCLYCGHVQNDGERQAFEV